MNIEFIVAIISIVLQSVTMAAAWTLGGATRWRRARWFSAVTFSAAGYSVVNAFASWQSMQGAIYDWAMTANLTLATVHAASWLVFAFIDDEGRWQSVPRWARVASLTSVSITALLVLTGVVGIVQPVPIVHIALFDIDVRRPEFNTPGQVLALVPLTLFVASAWGYIRRVRAGERGAGAILLGFGLFLLFTLEEVAVALRWIEFIYLADLGYVSVVAPVAWQMLSGFRDDANQLDQLSSHLSDEVRRRTEERDEARRVMLEQQRLASLGRLAAGVGHEINNPLQYLRFNLEELREHRALAVDAGAREAIEQAFEGVERIRQVVDGLRTYARPGADDMAPLDVREVARAAIRVAAPQWRQGITVVTQMADVPLVDGHEGRLVQAVLNPLVNGAQAMLAQGDPARMTLTVRLGVGSDGWVEIEVRDEGPGFAPEVTARLGEPYMTTKAAAGGTGLGLFVMRGIIEAHGGTVSFANNAGGGARVLMRVPPALASRLQSAAGRRTPKPVLAIPIPATPLRVLLVEDEPAALQAIERGLTTEGLEVVAHSKARDALRWLSDDEAARRIDVVVTDLMMPEVSGSQFAAALAQRHPHLRERLVVLTGGAATAEEDAFLQEPDLLVLNKPITRQQLAAQLRQRALARDEVDSES